MRILKSVALEPWLKPTGSEMFSNVSVACSDCFGVDRAEVHAPGLGQCSPEWTSILGISAEKINQCSLFPRVESLKPAD